MNETLTSVRQQVQEAREVLKREVELPENHLERDSLEGAMAHLKAALTFVDIALASQKRREVAEPVGTDRLGNRLYVGDTVLNQAFGGEWEITGLNCGDGLRVNNASRIEGFYRSPEGVARWCVLYERGEAGKKAEEARG